MATLIHFDKDDEFTEEDMNSLGIGIGHRDDKNKNKERKKQ